MIKLGTIKQFNFNLIKIKLHLQKINFDVIRVKQLIMRTDAAQGFKIFINYNNDDCGRHITLKRCIFNKPSWLNNDVKQAIGRRQGAFETKRMNNNEETNS